MDPTLHQLLTDISTNVTPPGGRGPTNNEYSHVTLYGPHAYWMIKPSKYSELWRGYCELVAAERAGLCLCEKPQPEMPVIVQCDLKFNIVNPEDQNRELYDNRFILAVVYCYQQAMQEAFQIGDNQVTLTCVVLESVRPWIIDNQINTSFRLHFPYCRVDVTYQIRSLRSRAIQLLHLNDVLKRISFNPVGGWENIIDPIAPQEPLLMYGSTLTADRPRMVFQYIFGTVMKEHINSSDFSCSKELSEVFAVANHLHCRQSHIQASLFADMDIDFWIPLFLSSNYWTEPTQLKLAQPMDKIKIIAPQAQSPKATTPKEQTDLEVAEQLMGMLSRERVENDHYWTDVGKCLYTCTGGSDAGLNAWIRFTGRSDNHSDDDCRSLYYNFRDNNLLSIETIMWYAREDNREHYLKWHWERCRLAMTQATSALHTDVAQALYQLYRLEFKCSSAGNSPQFWHFKNHRWHKLDHGVTLRQEISEGFVREFERFRLQISHESAESHSGDDREKNEALIKKITNLIAKLKTVSFKSNILKEAAELFYDGKFDSRVDENDSLLGMLDCVLQILPTHAISRPGKPEDYISMCTNLPFVKDLTWDHPLVKRVMHWMRQVFPDEQLKEYFLRMMASCLKGRNIDKIFPIFSGDGDNSKSMIVKLLELCYGNYSLKFPVQLLTQRGGSSSAATPELARAKGTRIAFLQEPDDEETIKGGILKGLTGGDSLPCRALYSNGGEIQLMFKTILMCNKVPVIPTGGKAVKNRALIVPFLSTWVSNPPVNEEDQFKQRLFKKDPFFERCLPELAKAFMWIMVTKYADYVSGGLTQPPIVKQTTEGYWHENDVYQNFLSDTVVRAVTEKGETDLNSHILHADLYREFKSWFKDNCPGQKVPDSKTAFQDFNRILGKQSNKKWHGLRIIVQDNSAAMFK